jgi:hypothetical protein
VADHLVERVRVAYAVLAPITAAPGFRGGGCGNTGQHPAPVPAATDLLVVGVGQREIRVLLCAECAAEARDGRPEPKP